MVATTVFLLAEIKVALMAAEMGVDLVGAKVHMMVVPKAAHNEVVLMDKPLVE